MTDHPIAPEVTEQLDAVGHRDVVLGVVCLNSERTVRRVVEAAVAGLRHGAPHATGVVIVADAGSRDGTPEAAQQAETGASPVIVARASAGPLAALARGGGLPGKGGGLLTVFAAAERLGARACVVLDADVAAVLPEWVRRLLHPVLHDGLDLVAPVYARHVYDGMLTSFLLYPLTRALYGWRLRQPVGGHFGCSSVLARRLLAAGARGRGGGQRLRLDLWTTTTALAEGLAVGQALLGAGRRGQRDTGAALGPTFVEVAETAFALMEDYRTAWWPVVETREVATFGDAPEVGVEPVSVNVDRMAATFRQGLADLMPVWRKMLAPDTCEALAALDAGPDGATRCPAALWARAVYDGAVAFHQRRLAREHLLRALVPLYLGRAAAFVTDTASDAQAAAAEVEAQCAAFESLKPYLLDRWDDRRP